MFKRHSLEGIDKFASAALTGILANPATLQALAHSTVGPTRTPEQQAQMVCGLAWGYATLMVSMRANVLHTIQQTMEAAAAAASDGKKPGT